MWCGGREWSTSSVEWKCGVHCSLKSGCAACSWPLTCRRGLCLGSPCRAGPEGLEAQHGDTLHLKNKNNSNVIIKISSMSGNHIPPSSISISHPPSLSLSPISSVPNNGNRAKTNNNRAFPEQVLSQKQSVSSKKTELTCIFHFTLRNRNQNL